MSLRQFAISLDSVLEKTFDNASLPADEWFAEMEEIIKRSTPRRYGFYKPYDVALAYVRWKYTFSIKA
jgi:hypothetical protein